MGVFLQRKLLVHLPGFNQGAIYSRLPAAKEVPARLMMGPVSKSSSSPEQIVAAKVSQFGRKRRDLVHGIARRTQKQIPPEVEKFFNAVEAGDWTEIETLWKEMAKRSGQYDGSTHSPELDPFWCAILETYGAAEQAHDWPAQKLLDYGDSILTSLRPGMVYVGGTDEGRFIPTLLNETGETEPHIVLTQNALADGRYLEYVRTTYGDRFTAPTDEDSQHAFAEYTADAQKRLEHDQNFPNEPKQLRPNEKVEMVDGKVQVSGQVAVMAINEKILQTIQQKNPDLSFALQESWPFKGTYSDAVPLGPIMELGAAGGAKAFTAERSAQDLDYWRSTAQQLITDPEFSDSIAALKSYSHNATAAANLLAAHSFNDQAEQTFRLSSQLWPGNPEPVAALSELLGKNGRMDEAQKLVSDFVAKNPDQRTAVESLRWKATSAPLTAEASQH